MLQIPDSKTLLDLADYMERLDPERYHQPIYNTCTNKGCIAFHATEMLGIKVSSFQDVAARIGITDRQARLLFHADAGQKNVMGLMVTGPTPKEAAKAIRHLAVTGEVPEWWTKFVTEEALRDAGTGGDVLHDLEPVDVS